MTKNRLAMIVALCALAVFATASFGMDGMAVSPGGWYHVSAQFLVTNSAQKLSVNLRYTDADGKPCGEERVLSSGGKSSEKLFRLHKVVRVPFKAVKCKFVTKGGEGLVRGVKLDASMADCRDETNETQLLNGSFEEADLTPDFIDCWHVVRGNVERITGDTHHGSYALRLAAGAVLSYAASDAAAIATCGSEALNGYLAVRRGIVAVNFAFRDKNGRDCGSKRLRFKGGSAWRGHEFR
ncbi:MAG: hypothetical protein IKK82_10325, partial [Kiritimatiellae bacterium]|nr:hypothetical protein [Kiritimatiellia bacterium]